MKEALLRNVSQVQLEDCGANNLPVKDRLAIPVTQEIVGSATEDTRITCFYGLTRQIYALQSGEDLLTDQHLELVVPITTNTPPFPPLNPPLTTRTGAMRV